jgi:hypothetical protein
MKRNPGESFEDYKKRRAQESTSTKNYLKGQVVKATATTPGIVKKAKKIEKKFEKAGALVKARLFKTFKTVEKKLEDLKK